MGFNLLPDGSGSYRLEQDGMMVGVFESKQAAMQEAEMRALNKDVVSVHDRNGMIKDRVEISGQMGGGNESDMAMGMTEDGLAEEMQGGIGDDDGDLYADDDDKDGLFSGAGPFTGF